MQVLVLGGGTVGGFIAKRLSEQRHDVTVVECRPEACREVDQSDVRVVLGDALKASVLFQAGATSADVCFALTGSDEANLLAGSVARGMGSHRVAARINSIAYRDFASFDYRRHFHIDRFLTQDYLTAVEIVRRIREPGAMLIEYFVNGELELQDVLITRESEYTDKPLAELKLAKDVRVAAITRDGVSQIATASDTIMLGDRVALIGTRPQVEKLKKGFKTGAVRRPYVIVAGGGETGVSAAWALYRRGYDVKVFDRDKERCEQIASRLKNSVTVVHGDCRRESVLDEQGVGSADFFIGCTGDDEYNIMTCVEARALGAKACISIIRHSDYAGVVKKLGIDEAVSPFEVMARQAEGFMHAGALVFQKSTILNGPAEVVEIEVGENSTATRSTLRDLDTPLPTLIASVVRDNQVMMPHADFTFKQGDFVVALTNKPNIPELVNLFEAEKNAA
ncbi:MAG: Trk system potassium transporter TrkA [Thermoguttaceae bacterium]|jgi:trk system potassium uptake protein TrkA